MGSNRTVFLLASILSFRMLGLFMIYPIFAIYAPQFHDATPTLIGIALGIYGLTQAMLQLPLSMLSDRIGRKPVITGGLIVFALGSIIAALTQNIYLLVFGRALQGAGAIGSTIMAFAADITSPANRTKAMAILGMTIGLSFAIAMVIGPLINNWLHLSGIFWCTALFAISGLLMTHYGIPSFDKKTSLASEQSYRTILLNILKQRELTHLNLSIFCLHALFTASFVIVPLLFAKLEIPVDHYWQIYTPILIGSFLVTLPILFMAERKKLIKQGLLLGISLIAIAEVAFYYSIHLLMTLFSLGLFFIGFTLLESLLPSLVSKLAPTEHKGTAMGIYSTFQFFGIFAGGALAGLVRSHYGSDAIFFYSFIACLIWFCYIGLTKSSTTGDTALVT